MSTPFSSLKLLMQSSIKFCEKVNDMKKPDIESGLLSFLGVTGSYGYGLQILLVYMRITGFTGFNEQKIAHASLFAHFGVNIVAGSVH